MNNENLLKRAREFITKNRYADQLDVAEALDIDLKTATELCAELLAAKKIKAVEEGTKEWEECAKKSREQWTKDNPY